MNSTIDPVYFLEARRQYGNLIKQIRQEKLLTQQQLADQIGMSCLTVLNIEEGNLNYGIDTLTIFAKHLDFSLYFLDIGGSYKVATLPAWTILKICRRCKESKPDSFFVKNKQIKSGYSNICNECNSRYYREKVKPTKGPDKRRKTVHLSGDQVVQKMHDYYYKLGYLPTRQELQVLKSEIGIKGLAIKKEFKKQFDLHFKHDNPGEILAKCNKCGAVKKMADFKSAKKSIYGIGNCKECVTNRQKKLANLFSV